MEILYNITTGPKAAYTGPQLNLAAGTEHILLELNLTSRVQQATKQILKASKQDAFPFPDTERASGLDSQRPQLQSHTSQHPDGHPEGHFPVRTLFLPLIS